MPEIQTSTQAMGGLVRAMLAHAWSILSFKHHGQGLRLGDLSLLIFGFVAVLSVFATASITPSSPDGHHPLVVGAITAAIFACCFTFCGRACAAGFILMTIATEPVSIVLRLVGLGGAVDTAFTLWVLVAQLVFFFRAAGAESRA